jgi:uncharacterized protein YndB with AHSA1/START domain
VTASVRRTVEVGVDPATAFELFTAHIGEWYVGGPHAWRDPSRAVGMRLEPGVGGRWIEVWDRASGEGCEHGVVRVWEPASRLVVAYRHPWLPAEPPTELEIRFDACDAGTRVVLEHRGFERLPADAAARFLTPRAWSALMSWFTTYAAARTGGA